MADDVQEVVDTAGATDQVASATTDNQPGSIVQGGTPAAAADTKPIWPEDWRAQMAGGDEKALKQLERYGSPADIYKKARELETKLSSGAYKKVEAFPSDGTPEQQMAWRKENGIPDSPDGYSMDLPDGLVLGEADIPVAKEFLGIAHAANMRPDQARAALKWYAEFAETQRAQQYEQDNQQKVDGIVAMKQQLGAEFEPTKGAVMNLVSQLPEDVQSAFLNARGADGRLLFNIPEFVMGVADWARQINPAATVMGAKGTSQDSIAEEFANMQKLVGDPSSEYWKGPNAERLQKRYGQLVQAMQKAA
jgi:protein-tyrosine-phosphatase